MEAIAILFDSEFRVKGKVIFKQLKSGGANVHVIAKDLTPGLHAIHIHKSGDLSAHCDSLCSHYNPFNMNHGGRKGENRHLGDFGNIKVNRDGKVRTDLQIEYLPLVQDQYGISIIGRSVIIHQGTDDLGKGKGSKRSESLKTGNAGQRVLCGVIGYGKNTCV